MKKKNEQLIIKRSTIQLGAYSGCAAYRTAISRTVQVY